MGSDMKGFEKVQSAALAHFISKHIERLDFESFFLQMSVFSTLRWSEFRESVKTFAYPERSLSDKEVDENYSVTIFMGQLNSMLLRVHVEDMLVYMKDIIAIIFKAEPKVMASSENIPLEMALKCDTINELVDFCAAQRLSRVSYFGLRDLRKELARVGIEVNLTEFEEEKLTEAVSMRNKIVHSYGLHAEYISKSDVQEYSPNEMLLECKEVIRTFVNRIDNRACDKFKLEDRGFASRSDLE